MPAEVSSVKLSDDPRFEALKLLKDWSTWMVTEGVMIGFLVNALPKALTVTQTSSGSQSRDLANSALVLRAEGLQCAILAFAISAAMAAWVIGSLPSITQRLRKSGSHRDLGAHAFFDLPILRWIPLYTLTFLQHLFFVVGILSLGFAVPIPEAILRRLCSLPAWWLVLIPLATIAVLAWGWQVTGGGVTRRSSKDHRTIGDFDASG